MPKYNTPYTGPVGHVGLAERRRIVESVVGPVDWNEGGIWGYCTCPGIQHHSNSNGRRDCRVYAEETRGGSRTGGTLPPGATCLHTSCGSAIEEASRRIRSEIGKAKVAAAGPRAGGNKSATMAPIEANRTARTPVFKFSEKGANDSRTVRTDISRPYALHAHAHAHTHVPAITEKLPSEPSVVAAPVAQPEQRPVSETTAPAPETRAPGIIPRGMTIEMQIEARRTLKGYRLNGEWVTTEIIPGGYRDCTP